MSYIQVLLGGKDRGLKFNQGALIKVRELIDPNNTAGTSLYAVVYAGLLMNAYAKREEFVETIDGKQVPISYETVIDWVDELTPEKGVEILNTFYQIQAFQKLLPKEEEDKKKLTETNIQDSAISLPAD